MLNEIKNSIDFFIRNNTKFSRKNFVEKNPELVERNRQENLYTTDILNKYLRKIEAQELNILDVGCKNWFYAKAEYEFFKSFCNDIFLDGVEIDAHRLYSNFYSRFEVAKFYTKGLDSVNYISDNLLNINKKYDYIIWFLPFVFEEPHKYWGLPKNIFYPKKLLEHAYSLLKNDGQMLIINQGLEESQEQERLLKLLNLPYENLGKIESEYFEYKYSRYGFLVRK